MIGRIPRFLAISVVALLWAALGHAQNSISAAEAKDHVGESCRRCGHVVARLVRTACRGAKL